MADLESLKAVRDKIKDLEREAESAKGSKLYIVLRRELVPLREKEERLAAAAAAGAGSGGGGGGGPMLLADEHPLNKFMACLIKKKGQFACAEAGQIVSLDKGVCFPATRMSQLYVRCCFLELLACDAAYRKKRPFLTLTYVTGTPGMGKSCCGALHLCWCLVKNKTVILEIVGLKGSKFFRLKLGEKVTKARDPTDFTEELAREDVCYIVDGGLPSETHFKAMAWAYTSPRAMSTRALRKVLIATGAHTLKMPEFSLDELLLMGRTVECFKKISEETITLLFKLAGGSARIVLEGPAVLKHRPSDVQALLKSKIKDLSGEAVQAMQAELGDVGFSSSADTLMHWHVLTAEEVTGPGRDDSPKDRDDSPGRDDSPKDKRLRRFKEHVLQFASPVVAALVARHVSLTVRRLCASFLLTHHGDPSTAGVSGTQFEQLVHFSLPNVPTGTVLRMKLLGGGQEEFELRLPLSKPLVFSSAVDAADASRADCKVYLMPASSNFAAIDCLSSRKLLFQVASGSSHTINLNSIKNTCQAVTADKAKFEAAHDALVGMLSLRNRKRKREGTVAGSRRAVSALLDDDRPLLVFVTPDIQYPKWNTPQQYKVPGGYVKPTFPPVQQAVMCFPTQKAARFFLPLEE